MDLTFVIRELKKEDLGSASEAAFLEYTTDPVLELFDTAYSEWTTHHVGRASPFQADGDKCQE
ncbi:hypothetical protein ES703_61444 [subsurface metagenome]